jgi:hypothetical protein
MAMSPTTSQVNCRYANDTGDMDINYYTCTAMADRYGITTDIFFLLNPSLKTDCSNIKADTDYCVSGCKCSWSSPSLNKLSIEKLT